ncbi:MAG TPA: DUF2092 domain-containing protein [Chthonomonadaceae bacterium]|nr:DUF2092 domain-containing protein [Chthonomonadaceae bacterium]
MSLRAAGVDGLSRVRPSTPLVRSLVVLLAALSLAGSQAAHAADNAGNVLRKMATLYNNARSYEGTVTVHNGGKSPDGKKFTVTSTQHVRFRSPNLIQASISMQGTGAAARFAQGGQIITSDGHTMYRYVTAQKQYMKFPAPPRLTLMQILNLPNFDTTTAKVVGSTTVNGHAAAEVEAKPAMPSLPANLPAQQKAQIMANMKNQWAKMKPIRLAIDKQGGQILRVTITTPAGPATIDFSSQMFNPAIPSSAFTFKPPAGAKELTMPTPRGPGAPGPPGVPVPPSGAPGGRRP